MPKYVITAWAESASGPGWANQPVWYLTRDDNGKLEVECLQPNDQTKEMQILYAMSDITHRSMTAAVRKIIGPHNPTVMKHVDKERKNE